MCENAKGSIEEVMEQIDSDPIIAFYLKMSQSTEHETSLPMYNETQLRLSIKQICSRNQLRPNEVQLYSRLLLFYYAHKYRSMEQLLAIMTTFSEQDVIDCFDRVNEIRTVWHQFIQKHLLYNMHRDAFEAILYEWSRRYYHRNGQLQRSMLEIKADSLLQYIRWDTNRFQTWLKMFINNLLCSNLMKETDDLKDVTEADLLTSNIVADIWHKLPMLMMEFITPFKTIKESKQFTLTAAIPIIRAQDFLTMPSADSNAHEPPAPAFVKKYEALENTAEPLFVPRSAPARRAAGTVKELLSLQTTTRCTRSSARAKLLAKRKQSPPAAKKAKRSIAKVLNEPVVYNAAIKEEPLSLTDETIEYEMKLPSVIKSEITIDESEDHKDQSHSEIKLKVSDTELSSSFCSIDSDKKEKISVDNDDLKREPTDPPTITHYELPRTLDYRSANSYIAALQGYAVHHGYVDAILLLNKVDSIFWTKQKK